MGPKIDPIRVQKMGSKMGQKLPKNGSKMAKIGPKTVFRVGLQKIRKNWKIARARCFFGFFVRLLWRIEGKSIQTAKNRPCPTRVTIFLRFLGGQLLWLSDAPKIAKNRRMPKNGGFLTNFWEIYGYLGV